MSVIKLVNFILTLMNKKNLKPVILNQSKKEIKVQKLNDNKIRKELNWKQSNSMREGLIKTINWYKKNQSLLKG